MPAKYRHIKKYSIIYLMRMTERAPGSPYDRSGLRALLGSPAAALTIGPSMTPSRDIARLLEIMAALRTPGSGCPWDLEQNFATLAPYTLEEAYEAAEAIVR